MSRGSLTLGGVITAAALALTGCQSVDQDAIDAQALACPEGSDCFDPVRPLGDGSTLELDMGDFFFDNFEGVALEGPVTIVANNVGGQVHNFRIDAAATETKKVEAAAGETGEDVLELFSGEYTYYCDISGHRQSGMEGTLTVYATEDEAREAGALDDDETEAPTEDATEADATSTEAESTEEPTEPEATSTEG